MSFPQRLRDGYRSFRSGRLPTEQSRYRDLAEQGQSPETMVVGCCDSRVAPEVIFDAGPGELFVVRNVANLVPPYSPDSNYHGVSAAVEYAVTVLKVRNIVVLGHARCGGIQAFGRQRAARRLHRPLDVAGGAGAEADRVARAQRRASYLTRLEQASVVLVDRQPDDVPLRAHRRRARRRSRCTARISVWRRASSRCSSRHRRLRRCTKGSADAAIAIMPGRLGCSTPSCAG